MELRGYRFEPLALALAALSAVNVAGGRDRIRYELTQHIVP